uniref:7TM_GPCR_Srx domain-containing protein n=1 Tax=Heterorhabditis bacteriophora TaxID=37862 RepID=A0A1I7WEU2_HETBA
MFEIRFIFMRLIILTRFKSSFCLINGSNFLLSFVFDLNSIQFQIFFSVLSHVITLKISNFDSIFLSKSSAFCVLVSLNHYLFTVLTTNVYNIRCFSHFFQNLI